MNREHAVPLVATIGLLAMVFFLGRSRDVAIGGVQPEQPQPADTAYQRKAIAMHVDDATMASCGKRLNKAHTLIASHPDWSYDVVGATACKRVIIGMTSEQLVLSMGAPDKVNRTITARAQHEQWVYGDTYVYLDEGVVTAIQD